MRHTSHAMVYVTTKELYRTNQDKISLAKKIEKKRRKRGLYGEKDLVRRNASFS